MFLLYKYKVLSLQCFGFLLISVHQSVSLFPTLWSYCHKTTVVLILLQPSVLASTLALFLMEIDRLWFCFAESSSWYSLWVLNVTSWLGLVAFLPSLLFIPVYIFISFLSGNSFSVGLLLIINRQSSSSCRAVKRRTWTNRRWVNICASSSSVWRSGWGQTFCFCPGSDGDDVICGLYTERSPAETMTFIQG